MKGRPGWCERSAHLIVDQEVQVRALDPVPEMPSRGPRGSREQREGGAVGEARQAVTLFRKR